MFVGWTRAWWRQYLPNNLQPYRHILLVIIMVITWMWCWCWYFSYIRILSYWCCGGVNNVCVCLYFLVIFNVFFCTVLFALFVEQYFHSIYTVFVRRLCVNISSNGNLTYRTNRIIVIMTWRTSNLRLQSAFVLPFDFIGFCFVFRSKFLLLFSLLVAECS